MASQHNELSHSHSAHSMDHHHEDTPNTPLTKHYPIVPIRTKTVNNDTYRSVSTSPRSSFDSDAASPIKTVSRWYCTLSNWFKILISLVIITVVVVAIVHNEYTFTYSQQFLKWMDRHPIQGSIAYIG